MTAKHTSIELKTEMCHLASEMRLLGFEEEAIRRLVEMDTKIVREMIAKYKNALDLMGDETD